jgi:hypothetical protein
MPYHIDALEVIIIHLFDPVRTLAIAGFFLLLYACGGVGTIDRQGGLVRLSQAMPAAGRAHHKKKAVAASRGDVVAP